MATIDSSGQNLSDEQNLLNEVHLVIAFIVNPTRIKERKEGTYLLQSACQQLPSNCLFNFAELGIKILKCRQPDSEGGYRSSVRLGPQVRVGGEGSGGNQSHWACEFIHAQRLRPAMKPTARDPPWPAHCSEQRKGAGARRSQSRVAPQGSQRAARRRRGSAPSPGRLRGPAQKQQQTHQARQTQQQNDPSG